MYFYVYYNKLLLLLFYSYEMQSKVHNSVFWSSGIVQVLIIHLLWLEEWWCHVFHTQSCTDKCIQIWRSHTCDPPAGCLKYFIDFTWEKRVIWLNYVVDHCSYWSHIPLHLQPLFSYELQTTNKDNMYENVVENN